MVAARRLLLGTVAVGCALAAVVFCFGGVAFAAAPEAPSQPTVSSTKATPVEEVSLFGFLYPGAPGEPGSYEFLYKQSATECQGGSKGPVGAATGEQFEAVFETLTGLQPGERYTICLAVTSPGGTTLSAPVTILTPIAPEQPTGLKAEPVGAFTATLNGTLNPSGERKAEPGTYEYLYRQSPSECEGEEEGQLSTAPTTAAGAKEEVVSVPVANLLPNTQYTFCLRQTNEIGEVARSEPQTFTTLAAAPKIEEISAVHVTADSATLTAEINPEGAETSYAFEYAPAGGVFVPVPEAHGKGTLSEGTAGTRVSAHLQGLSAHASYEVRVTVANTLGTVVSMQLAFTTQTVGVPFMLPDDRAWEMVSPPQKEGAPFGVIGSTGGAIIQAAADGNAFTDWSFFIPIESNAASGSGFMEANFFGRGEHEWSAKTISPQHKLAPFPLGRGMEYRFFSEDLSKAILQPFGPPIPLAPDVSQSTAYVRTDYLNGDRSDQCTTNCYAPLIDDANVPVGTPYGEEVFGQCEKITCGPQVVATSPDLNHVLLSSPVDLTGNAPEGGIYEWSEGRVNYVGTGYFGCNTGFCSLQRHVISDDGSRVFLSGSYEGMEGLLLREPAADRTVRLDASQSGVPQPPAADMQFEDASANGTRAFFTDAQSLTEASGEGDLYEYSLDAQDGNRLTDLTAAIHPGEPSDVSSVLGNSEDGSYVYFAASGALAPGATRATCTGGQPCMNLYVRHGGTTKFIVGLGEEDWPDWRLQESKARGLLSRVSPDGQWLEFMSNRDLTGYDTADAISGRPDEEVYLYNADSGRLVCASCDPTGASPIGAEYGRETAPAFYKGNGEDFGETTWIAANVPQWTNLESSNVAYQSRYLSDGGRLFFNSHDALVPQDVDGTEDVYEYEPAGVGNCTTVSAWYVAASAGCVSLVSSGESDRESVFLDASENGSDVFFLTTSKLMPRDTDNAFDIYDARECGLDGLRCFPKEPGVPAPCDTGDACKPPPTPQPAIFGAPASSTFTGTRNFAAPNAANKVKAKRSTSSSRHVRELKRCARLKKHRRRQACRRKVQLRYAASKHRKAASKRSGR